MILIPDLGLGNIHSLQNALRLFAADVVHSSDSSLVSRARAVILPGDGHFDQAMEQMEKSGFGRALTEYYRAGGSVFAICIGFQILFERSEEGQSPGLGWLTGAIRRFPGGGAKVPHMGWNEVDLRGDHPVLAGLPRRAYFYFIHSYFAAVAENPEVCVGSCDYNGRNFSAVVARGNLVATQFHPEKSYSHGLRLLKNFTAGIDAPQASATTTRETR